LAFLAEALLDVDVAEVAGVEVFSGIDDGDLCDDVYAAHG